MIWLTPPSLLSSSHGKGRGYSSPRPFSCHPRAITGSWDTDSRAYPASITGKIIRDSNGDRSWAETIHSFALPRKLINIEQLLGVLIGVPQF